MNFAKSELILGGQRSGKSRRAELIAAHWLARSSKNRAVLIATAQPWDDEMRIRIARHQTDRARRLPGLQTVEEPLELAGAVARHSMPDTLVVVDCLTLWLTHLLMPFSPAEDSLKESSSPEEGGFKPIPVFDEHIPAQAAMHLIAAISHAAGPIVLDGNEIGLGVIPMGRETRAFVDALGQLNQAVAEACERVVFMAAGQPLFLKGSQ